MNKKHITIQEVASQAGVSIQTVSRVLNDRPDVAPETRKRIQQIISDLGYQPFAIARGLASRRTHTLGLITTDFNDFFFTQVVTGAEEEAHRRGYFFMLGNACCSAEEEPEYLRLLAARHVEGVLFARMGSPDDEQHLRRFQANGIPVVTTGFHLNSSTDISYVDVNNLEGGWRATRSLIDSGHTQIAMITGPMQAKSANDRAKGYYNALEESGLQLNSELIVHGNWTHRGGYDGMFQLLNKNLTFTAIFAHNDRIAIGALAALRRARIRVPEDVSIIGFDDIPEAEFADPPLTTIRQPMTEVGRAATRLLIKLIEETGALPEQIVFDTELVQRVSSAGLNVAINI